MPRSQTSTVTSRIAGLADGPQQVISGTAVGVGDVTRGLSGDRKVWTAEELREAAESLTGADLKALHSETVVGEVTDAGFVAGEGVVYEAEIKDEELAEAIANGRLTVSVEARHGDGGTVETEQGDAMAVTDIEFSDLAIVQHGAAPSASAKPGEAAALSPAEVRAALEDDDPASTEGDPEDIEISDSVEEGLENKVEEHNEEVDAGKEVTLGQLKKVFRRGAGAWFSSNKGATQQQWAYARVNEALKDIRNEKAINHGNDNDIFEDSVDYEPPDEEQSAALVEVNGTEVDLEAPAKVKNAVEAAMDAKDEYSDAVGDCGTGVGEEMGQAILDDELTPEIVTSGGDIAQYGPSTYLDGHGDEGPSTNDPPTDWGRMEWLGMESEDDSPRCGPVQLAMWGFYQEPFEEMKEAVENARDSENMAESTEAAEVPEAYQFGNPGEAVEEAKYLGVGEDRDLAGDEMIHTEEVDGETVFFPAPTRDELLDRLREEGELAEPLVDRPTDGDTRVVVHTPTEQDADPETVAAVQELVATETGADLDMSASNTGVLTGATPDRGMGVREFRHIDLDVAESAVQNALGKVQKSSLHVAGDAEGLSLHPCFEVDGSFSDETLGRMAELFALVANHRVAVGMMDGMVAFDPREPVLSHAALDVAEIITRRMGDANGVTVTANTFRAAETLDAEVTEPPSLPTEMAHHEESAAGDIRLPLPSENVQLLYPEESTAANAAEAMGLEGTHPHDFEGETWYMPGASHSKFVDAVSGMDAGMAGLAPLTKTARLNEYKSVGPISFRGTRQGELDESAIPTDDFESHYFNDGENKSDSSFPLVDGEGYLRRGNLDAAWNLRGQGDLGMPRDSAERLMLNLGLVFGPPDSEGNPLPQDAYDERDDVGTPYAEESAQAARLATVTDDPETGEATADARMTENQAQLGSYLARAMSGKMEELAYDSEMGHAEMMREMASHCGMSESHMRSIRRGDTACPSMDAIEAMADVLDADMEMLLDAAKRDGCDYSEASYHDDDDDADDEEKMSDDPNENERIAELEETVAELREENREVKREYAEALAGDALLSAEELMEKFTVSELSEKFDEADAELAPTEPTVRGGDAPTEAADLSAGEQKRAEELEADLAEWQDRDSRLADAEVDRIESELAELRGDD